MALSKNQRLSKLGKKGARIRWNKIEQNINQNIALMKKETYTNLKSRLLGYLAGDGGTSAQQGFMKFFTQANEAVENSSATYAHYLGTGTATEVSTGALTFTVSVQHGQSDASNTITSEGSFIDIIK